VIRLWITGCADPDYPGVYARVSDGYSWISSQVCKYSKYPPSTFKCQKRRSRNRQLRGPASASSTPLKLECHDADAQETFDLDGKFINKNCEWLATNRQFDEEDLCDYIHIAYRCPNTCDACDLVMAEDNYLSTEVL
jgi:hypothetical protein